MIKYKVEQIKSLEHVVSALDTANSCGSNNVCIKNNMILLDKRVFKCESYKYNIDIQAYQLLSKHILKPSIYRNFINDVMCVNCINNERTLTPMVTPYVIGTYDNQKLIDFIYVLISKNNKYLYKTLQHDEYVGWPSNIPEKYKAECVYTPLQFPLLTEFKNHVVVENEQCYIYDKPFNRYGLYANMHDAITVKDNITYIHLPFGVCNLDDFSDSITTDQIYIINDNTLISKYYKPVVVNNINKQILNHDQLIIVNTEDDIDKLDFNIII